MAKKLTIEEALDYCLSNPEGLSQVELLQTFAEHREQLQPLLGIASRVSSAATPPPPLRREAIKGRLLQAAVQGSAPAVPASRDTVPLARQAVEVRVPRAPLRLPLPLRPLWSVAAAAAMLVFFVWWSASSALADSPFYDVKLNTENFMGNFSSAPADVIQHHTILARVRLDDIQAMASQGKLGKSGKAVDNFDFHIKGSTEALDQTSGDVHTKAAQQIYASSVAGDRVVGSLQGLTNISPALQESLKQAFTDTKAANVVASQALILVGIDPKLAPTPNAQAIVLPTPRPSTSGEIGQTIVVQPTATDSAGGPVAPGTTQVAPADPSATTGAVSPSDSPVPTTAISGGKQLPTSTVLVGGIATPLPGGPPPTQTPSVAQVPTNQVPSSPVGEATARSTFTGTPRSGASTNTPGVTNTFVPGQQPTRTYTPPRPPLATAVPTNTSVTASTGTPTRIGAATSTPTRISALTGTPTMISALTATLTRVSNSTPTNTPANALTNTPTHTPVNTPTNTPANTNTYTPTNTPYIQPTYTQVPPASTPTRTAQPTNTVQPPTPTRTQAPTNTPGVPTPGECPLEIDSVDAACSSASCVTWTAGVSNSLSSIVAGLYTVQLQIKQGSGPFHTISTQTGSASIGVGSTQVSGNICGSMPADTTAIKVIVTITTPLFNCNVHEASESADPCGESGTPAATSTPVVRATNTPRPSNTPRPTRTPHV